MPSVALSRRFARRLVPLLAGAGLAAAALTGPVATTNTASGPAAGTAPALASTSTDNPLAGRPWGVYEGPGEQSWQPYVDATGAEKDLLGYIALKPKAKWFGSWIPDDQIEEKVRGYIANAQAGNPDALVQMAIFRVKPWERNACRAIPTLAQRASYRRWMRGFAAGIGDAHVAVIQQPDGPFALCAPHGSRVASRLIAYGTRVLSAQPNASVYVEVGAADWPHDGKQGGAATATKLALRGGVKYARGIALNGTHYSSTVDEVARGAAVVRALAAQGITDKHVVINTAENGHPFEFGTYTGKDPNNAFVCKTANDPVTRTCVTLGIPPTTQVAAPQWQLPLKTRRLARRYVDAYLWFGRPWLYRQADPFVKSRALQLVRTTPFR